VQAVAQSDLNKNAVCFPKRGVVWLKIAITAVLLACLYSGVLAGLFSDWWHVPAWSQGLVIAPLAAYLAWERRSSVLSQPIIPSSKGVLLLGMACLLYLVGKLGAEEFLSRVSFIVLLISIIWTFWGIRRLRPLSFPLLLLTTSVPLPTLLYNYLTVPLQLFASVAATDLAQSLGVTVYRDGNVINLAHISLGVEEACSGLNSLAALFVAGLLLGTLVCRRFLPRLLLILATIPLAIATNVLRITGTALLADYHEDLAVGFYHGFAGWIVFLFAFAVLYGAAKATHALMEPKDLK